MTGSVHPAMVSYSLAAMCYCHLLRCTSVRRLLILSLFAGQAPSRGIDHKHEAS